jgi:hypothetical protein
MIVITLVDGGGGGGGVGSDGGRGSGSDCDGGSGGSEGGGGGGGGSGDGIVHSVHKINTALCAKLVMIFAVICDRMLFI